MSTKSLGDLARRGALAALAAVWVLPLWMVTFPPMVDYPQQLALSAILRWYGDPVRGFSQTYELALAAPHGFSKLAVAGLAWALPINAAGKLVVSLALVAVGAAALALCRRTGRPAVYALAALALTYGYIFYWGFLDNLIAFPLFLAGVALADRLFDGPFGVRAWGALALVGVLFYMVHLQFQLLFMGAVGWLALTRLPDWRRLARWLSALLPGLLVTLPVMLAGVLRAPEGVISAYELRMRAAAPLKLPLGVKLARLPELLFGPWRDHAPLVMAGLLLLLALLAWAARERTGEGRAPWRERLFQTRFASLAGWLALLYLALPEFRGGYLIAERIAPAAAMVAVAALPRPAPGRRRLVAFAAVALALFQLGWTLAGFLRFRRESAGLAELIAATEPGKNLAGLIFQTEAASWRMPVYLHFPAYYQVYKGGRLLFSFAELFNSPARFRPGKGWDGMLGEWNDWNPQLFRYGRHGGPFDYFLVRGGPRAVVAAFGPDPVSLGLRGRMAGRWILVERAPAPPGSPEP